MKRVIYTFEDDALIRLYIPNSIKEKNVVFDSRAAGMKICIRFWVESPNVISRFYLNVGSRDFFRLKEKKIELYNKFELSTMTVDKR